jgi:uncharacterized repeat protein (TIGR03806 family)
MNLKPHCTVAFAISILTIAVAAAAWGAEIAEDAAFGLERRVAWTTSRVIGSPDPPLPYSVEKVFTNISWRAPIFIIAEPGTNWLWVIQQGGEQDRPSKVLRVRDDPVADQVDTLLTVSNRLLYSVAFHPGYRTNGHFYLFSNGPTQRSERTNRISRFRMEKDRPDHEQVIIEWRSAGHDGGGMVFGHDGMFYISTGDGTSDSDTWNSGQTVDDLLGAVLRIDVDRPQGDRAYSVPKDNPFVGQTNARPELWAYGLRNPWRMSVDDKTGRIWVGNNGQDLWETVHLIRRGENYGWSVYEGSHPFYLNRKLGPTPPVAPTLEHHHAEARSLTGGVVYYGNQLPDLEGAYVYGDYSSGTIWGARHDETRVTWHKELARTELQIAAFAMNHRSELLIVDHGTGIYRLARNYHGPERNVPAFATRLSDTGIFTSTKEHRVQPGVIPYSVNAAGWADGAHIERFIGLPGETQIELTNGWTFPNGTVLIQTLSLASRRIETRLLTRQAGQWAGYSYRWNDEQSDAALVERNGDEVLVPGSDTLGRRKWRYPGRAECLACHSRAANFVLGFTQLQLDKSHDYGAVRDNQLRTLQHIGLFNGPKIKGAKEKLVDAYDATHDLDARARSYLHVNCSVCHVEAGGGNAKMELGASTKLEKMNLLEARPQHDTFGIDNAMLIAPGDPDRSILYQRVSRRGRGQMPPLVTSVTDDAGVTLLRDWIRAMKPSQKFVREWTLDDLLPALEQVKYGRPLESGRNAFRQTGCNQCHRFGGAGGSVGPELDGAGLRFSARDLLESILLPSKVIAEGYATTEIETKSGDMIAGRVEREDEQVLVIRQPLAADPVAIRKAEIRERTLSKTSNMPTGTLNTLEKEQILDLLAYLLGQSTEQ